MLAIILALELLSAKIQKTKTSYIVDKQCMEERWRYGCVVCCQVFDAEKKNAYPKVQTTTICVTGKGKNPL